MAAFCCHGFSKGLGTRMSGVMAIMTERLTLSRPAVGSGYDPLRQCELKCPPAGRPQ